MDLKGLRRLTVRQLLQLHASAVDELRRRGVVKSTNNPIADYAEALACHALGLVPSATSTKGYDATDSRHNRFEIKARRRATDTTPTRFSAIRDLNGRHFRYLVLVLFRDDYTVERGAVLTVSAVRKRAFYQKHINGWIVPLNENTWAGVGVREITRELRRAQFGV
jgi:hypothetical protein